MNYSPYNDDSTETLSTPTWIVKTCPSCKETGRLIYTLSACAFPANAPTKAELCNFIYCYECAGQGTIYYFQTSTPVVNVAIGSVSP